MTRTLVALVLCAGLSGAGRATAEQEGIARRKMPEIVGELKGAVPRVPNPGERRVPPPVPDGVRGTVTAAKDGYLVLSIGMDAGLVVGHTLDVYRADPKAPRYLGTVVIENIGGGGASTKW